MATVDLKKKNFEKKVSQSEIAIIDFWAPWCEPCKVFAPAFAAVSKSHPDILFAKVNVDTQQEVAGFFDVRSVPTIVVIRDNIVVYSQPGALPKSGLEDIIQQVRNLNMDEIRAAAAKEQAA